MDNAGKLRLLGGAARWDVSAPSTILSQDPVPDGSGAIYEALSPDGSPVRILKVLLSNACSYDCLFCPMRCSRSQPRASFRPDELARLVAEMRGAGLIDGLMLSSGIVGDTDATMERMTDTALLLRHEHDFRHHIHLKILPGASEAAIISAAQVADRLSLNVEAPTPEIVSAICPAKSLPRHLMRPLRQAVDLVAPGRVSEGVTTQFIVGAGDETDRQIIEMTWQLLAQVGVRAVHFSGFRPIEDTPLEGREPTSLEREHRLCQAEFLLRAYGFEPGEIVFDERDMLPLHRDPKLVSAEAREDIFPVEVNTAGKWELLRVPGVGPTCAERIIFARERMRLNSLKQLTLLGVRVDRARNFLAMGGRFYPRKDSPGQLTMEM